MEEETELAGYIRLVADLEKNHDFRDYGKEERLCRGCLQPMNFLIYSRQLDCISKVKVKKKRSQKMVRGRKPVVASADDFSLQPPA